MGWERHREYPGGNPMGVTGYSKPSIRSIGKLTQTFMIRFMGMVPGSKTTTYFPIIPYLPISSYIFLCSHYNPLRYVSLEQIYSWQLERPTIRTAVYRRGYKIDKPTQISCFWLLCASNFATASLFTRTLHWFVMVLFEKVFRPQAL